MCIENEVFEDDTVDYLVPVTVRLKGEVLVIRWACRRRRPLRRFRIR